MKLDYSYGIIPLRWENEEWEVLLVQHCAGHWAFPKGHPESGETPQQTAERELKEETSLTVVRYLSSTPFQENYFFVYKGEKIQKTVSYFPAVVEGNVRILEVEIQASQWLPLQTAKEFITFSEGKRICEEVITSLT